MDVNVYDDIAEFDLGDEIEKLKTENKLLDEHIGTLESDIETLNATITQLNENQERLTNNISSLYLTAKAEIDRKDRMIADLRMELDNMYFRRNNVGFQNKRKQTEDNTSELNDTKRFKSYIRNEDKSLEKFHNKNVCSNKDTRSRSSSIERLDRHKDNKDASKDTKAKLSNSEDKAIKHSDSENKDRNIIDKTKGTEGKDKRTKRFDDREKVVEGRKDDESYLKVMDRRNWIDNGDTRDDPWNARYSGREIWEDDKRNYENNRGRDFDNRRGRGRGRGRRFDDRPRWTDERDRRYNEGFRHEDKHSEWNYSRHFDRMPLERSHYGRRGTSPFHPVDNREYMEFQRGSRMFQNNSVREYNTTHSRETSQEDISTKNVEKETHITKKSSELSRSTSRASIADNENLSKNKPVKKRLKMLDAMEEKMRKKRSSLSHQNENIKSPNSLLIDFDNDNSSDCLPTKMDKCAPKSKKYSKDEESDIPKLSREKKLRNKEKRAKLPIEDILTNDPLVSDVRQSENNERVNNYGNTSDGTTKVLSTNKSKLHQQSSFRDNNTEKKTHKKPLYLDIVSDFLSKNHAESNVSTKKTPKKNFREKENYHKVVPQYGFDLDEQDRQGQPELYQTEANRKTSANDFDKKDNKEDAPPNALQNEETNRNLCKKEFGRDGLSTKKKKGQTNKIKETTQLICKGVTEIPKSLDCDEESDKNKYDTVDVQNHIKKNEIKVNQKKHVISIKQWEENRLNKENNINPRIVDSIAIQGDGTDDLKHFDCGLNKAKDSSKQRIPQEQFKSKIHLQEEDNIHTDKFTSKNYDPTDNTKHLSKECTNVTNSLEMIDSVCMKIAHENVESIENTKKSKKSNINLSENKIDNKEITECGTSTTMPALKETSEKNKISPSISKRTDSDQEKSQTGHIVGAKNIVVDSFAEKHICSTNENLDLEVKDRQKKYSQTSKEFNNKVAIKDLTKREVMEVDSKELEKFTEDDQKANKREKENLENMGHKIIEENVQREVEAGDSDILIQPIPSCREKLEHKVVKSSKTEIKDHTQKLKDRKENVENKDTLLQKSSHVDDEIKRIEPKSKSKSGKETVDKKRMKPEENVHIEDKNNVIDKRRIVSEKNLHLLEDKSRIKSDNESQKSKEMVQKKETAPKEDTKVELNKIENVECLQNSKEYNKNVNKKPLDLEKSSLEASEIENNYMQKLRDYIAKEMEKEKTNPNEESQIKEKNKRELSKQDNNNEKELSDEEPAKNRLSTKRRARMIDNIVAVKVDNAQTLKEHAKEEQLKETPSLKETRESIKSDNEVIKLKSDLEGDIGTCSGTQLDVESKKYVRKADALKIHDLGRTKMETKGPEKKKNVQVTESEDKNSHIKGFNKKMLGKQKELDSQENTFVKEKKNISDNKFDPRAPEKHVSFTAEGSEELNNIQILNAAETLCKLKNANSEHNKRMPKGTLRNKEGRFMKCKDTLSAANDMAESDENIPSVHVMGNEVDQSKTKAENLERTKSLSKSRDSATVVEGNLPKNEKRKRKKESTDSSTDENTIEGKQKLCMKIIYSKFDALIENHMKMSNEDKNETDQNKKDNTKSLRVSLQGKNPHKNEPSNSLEKPVIVITDVTEKESETVQVTCNNSNKPKMPTPTNITKNVTPDKTITRRRRITPTPVKVSRPLGRPVCSFENILERNSTSTSLSGSLSAIASPLHLTHEGEIPVLHLEENHINNLPTECNINDKNILNLMDTMNITNMEGDMTKFKNIPTETRSTSRDFNVNISPIKRDNLTFENVINTVTSTPVLKRRASECKDKAKTTDLIKSGNVGGSSNNLNNGKVVNSGLPTLTLPIRRRRRCRLIITD